MPSSPKLKVTIIDKRCVVPTKAQHYTWGMMERLLLKSLREMSVIGTASIRMLPSGSASLNKAAISDDFPAPVLPTTPTWNNSEKRTWNFVLVAETTNVLRSLPPGSITSSPLTRKRRKLRQEQKQTNNSEEALEKNLDLSNKVWVKHCNY